MPFGVQKGVLEIATSLSNLVAHLSYPGQRDRRERRVRGTKRIRFFLFFHPKVLGKVLIVVRMLLCLKPPVVTYFIPATVPIAYKLLSFSAVKYTYLSLFTTAALREQRLMCMTEKLCKVNLLHTVSSGWTNRDC